MSIKTIFSLLILMTSISAFADDGELVVAQAKQDLERSLTQSYVQSTDLNKKFTKLLDVLNHSELTFIHQKCTGKTANYVAYVRPGMFSSNLNIYFCEGWTFLPVTSKAQTLIHELSHLVLHTSEMQATRLETFAAYYGGRRPELTAYNGIEKIERLMGSSDAKMIKLGLDYFVEMDIRTITKFRELKLFTYLLYRDQASADVILGLSPELKDSPVFDEVRALN